MMVIVNDHLFNSIRNNHRTYNSPYRGRSRPLPITYDPAPPLRYNDVWNWGLNHPIQSNDGTYNLDHAALNPNGPILPLTYDPMARYSPQNFNRPDVMHTVMD